MTGVSSGNSLASWYGPPDGCDVAPHCLQCPLPLCRFDDPGGYQYWKRTKRRDEQIVELWDKGVKPEEIAVAVGCTPRTVWRRHALLRGEGHAQSN
jgi:hypothetical protein